MSLSTIRRNLHSERERKIRMNEITADSYTQTVADTLASVCQSPKHVTRLAGCGLLTAKNWWTRKNGPSGVQLVRLMRESDDMLFAILELAGKADVVKRAQALKNIEEAKALLAQVMPE